ncbi:hypothetical protein BKY29_10270 [Weissella confusa]|nr:hypothetical protein [Weissella confusa]OJF02749.1 hypothetical protein BKY29_10270 [Weissella confusa]
MTAEGNTTAKKSDIEAARERLQDDIKKATDARDAEVAKIDVVKKAVRNGTNDDIKKRVAAVEDAKTTGTASDIAKAIAK